MRQGWSHQKIALVLFPFGAAAMAVNIFFASLIGSWVGLPVLSAAVCVSMGCIVGAPATWFFARHIRKLMDQADENN
ncbi:MAG: membrane protein YqaA with SNARE-associated domain [Pseudorhodobacter sp.]